VYVNHKDPVLPDAKGRTLVVEATNFSSEGENSLARCIVNANEKDFRNIILYRVCGQRFIGCGFGTMHKPITIDIYGTPGDYLASGISNMEIRVHGDAQDQVGQIIGDGKLIIYGSVGQTFLYGAKTGEIYIRGNAAGRPLINAVGRPRVVINGTCLDYLAESFMAGNPLNGGGFVVINGITFKNGEMKELPSPYPGGNIFSLASGGAVYIRDPHQKLVEDQLNGGVLTPITAHDWEVIKPYLKENQELFGISLTDLLTVNGKKRQPEEVYRKITVQKLEVLS
jgi:glutamate synthase domain-containing protein 3